MITLRSREIPHRYVPTRFTRVCDPSLRTRHLCVSSGPRTSAHSHGPAFILASSASCLEAYAPDWLRWRACAGDIDKTRNGSGSTVGAHTPDTTADVLHSPSICSFAGRLDISLRRRILGVSCTGCSHRTSRASDRAHQAVRTLDSAARARSWLSLGCTADRVCAVNAH